MKHEFMRHEFVQHVPERLEPGVIYVSIPFATVIHACACGCESEVVTPLSPTDWKLTFDGESVSLYPSIGNWGFECRSHYWIEGSRVRWARAWSSEEIAAGRAHDRAKKERFYSSRCSDSVPPASATDDAKGEEAPVAAAPETPAEKPARPRRSSWLKRFWSKRWSP